MGLYKAKKSMFLKELVSPASRIESTANPFKVNAPSQALPDPSGSDFCVLQKMEKIARASIEEMVEKRIPRELFVRQIVVLGGASEEILQLSEKERVDLIVIATHGQTGWRHFVFGSVAEGVMRLAPCPVLPIRGSA